MPVFVHSEVFSEYVRIYSIFYFFGPIKTDVLYFGPIKTEELSPGPIRSNVVHPGSANVPLVYLRI